MEGEWLRWYDKEGSWISTYQERELQANQRADQEQQRANEADRRAELLSAKLRELGIDLDYDSQD
jgi:uncharacterized protein (DUF302 family)